MTFLVLALSCVCMLSRVQLFATPWTVARQALLSMGSPMQEYWSGLPFPSPGDLPNPGFKPLSLVSSTLVGRFFTPGPPGKPWPSKGCILSPCLFNLYAEYIMRNAGLDEAQAGIKIAGKNISNLR